VCGGVVEGAGAVCGTCWPDINFLAPPHCAVLAYDEGSRDPVLAFKHRDRTDAAPAFGAWLARAGVELLADADLLVPVPLHPARLLARRYNQSALLVHALSKASGIPAAVDLMVRTRRTPSQGRLSAAARRRNVAGAFAVRRGQHGRLRGRKLVLVDDVMTTGATVEGCARILLRSGAAAVDVLTLARVVRGAQ
jgi:ComF family protein